MNPVFTPSNKNQYIGDLPPIELDGPGVRCMDEEHQLQVAVPLGGIGAGCVCFNGHGGLQDFSVNNRPATSALPDSHTNFLKSAFALLHIKGAHPVTRLVEGPLPMGKVYDQGLQAQGYRSGVGQGLPRFSSCEFRGAYPFAGVRLRDSQVPLEVDVTAWSPFVPLDAEASGLPAAVLEYRLHNPGNEPLLAELSFHASHWAKTSRVDPGRNSRLGESGFLIESTDEAPLLEFGSNAVLVPMSGVQIKARWFRGAWFDAVSMIWREVSTGTFQENSGDDSTAHPKAHNGGSVLVPLEIAPGATVTVPVILAWHFPNGGESIGCCTTEGCCDDSRPTWSPHYATRFTHAGEVALHLAESLSELRAKTLAFQQALFSSNLPAELLDAISANLAILKSPTVLRQENGHLWGWEGCFTERGCCHGSCTHVWNYAQTFAHLFPSLERGLREQEWHHSMDEHGHVAFRASLPDGPTSHQGHAAADGQFGGILKLYRDWQTCGDDAWMRSLLPLARRALDFGIVTWDPERQGALTAPHHNTYDIEFWGPDGLCGSVYVGALSAMALMLEYIGDAAADEYRELATKAAVYMDTVLFNGEYYIQKVTYPEGFWREADVSPEKQQLLREEGPCYQAGTGCLSDGVIGAGWARLYGVSIPMDSDHVRSALASIHRHNLRHDLVEHANTQRPGYALGHEGGLLICTWPQGGKPSLPFVYSDEVWPGIEYQVATHLILEGMVEKGLEIVRLARQRFEGQVRNPWNEYECGSYYARSMASYSLLVAWSGLHYSAVTRTLRVTPATKQRPFRCFFSTEGAYGTVTLKTDAVEVDLLEGSLTVDVLELDLEPRVVLDAPISILPGKSVRIPLPPQK